MKTKMVIVVEESLDNIIQYLDSTNKYEIQLYGKYEGPTDVIIYANERVGKEIERYQNIVRNVTLQEPIAENHGILMINSRHKTPKEIESILDTRLYKNIF